MGRARKAGWLIIGCVSTMVFISCGEDEVGSAIGQEIEAEGPTRDDGQNSDAETDSGSGEGQDTDINGEVDIVDGGQSGSAPVSGPGSSLVGTWGQLVTVAVKQIGIPVVISQIVDSNSWYVVTIETDGQGNLTAREKLCAIKQRLETPLNKSVAPQNFVDHMEVLERHVSVASDEPGTPWISDDVYEVRGAKLENEETDPLPPNNSSRTNLSIPCDEASFGSQCDQDDDGHPGVTNKLTGAVTCHSYVTQRWHAKFEGEIVDEDTIAGPITDSFSEQTIIAANNPICLSSQPSTVSVLEKCPGHFYFKMVRMKKTANCQDVMTLTNCDEAEQRCYGDESFPLNPKKGGAQECR